MTNAHYIPVKAPNPKEHNLYRGGCKGHLTFRFVFPIRNGIVTSPPLTVHALVHRLANDAEKIVLQNMET